MMLSPREQKLKHYAPQPGPQTRFCASVVTDLGFGGAVGGGKSMALLFKVARYIHIPGYRALIVRRESKQFADLLKKATELYPAICPGARWRANPPMDMPHWLFPSGARIYCSHCKDEIDAHNFQGLEFQVIAYDELCSFTEGMVNQINTRCRGIVPGLPRHARQYLYTFNPGGPHYEWVKRRFGPWLDSRYEGMGLKPRICPTTGKQLPPLRDGEVLWTRRNLLSGEDERCDPNAKGAMSRTFIKSLITDNPLLLVEDPEYIDRLRNNLDPVRLEQLLHANWDVTDGGGTFFPKEKWTGRVLGQPPSKPIAWARYWDLACTEDGDWAVGVRGAILENGQLWIDDVARTRGDPGAIDAFFVDRVLRDAERVTQVIEQEPGSGGKFTIYDLTRSVDLAVRSRGLKRIYTIIGASPKDSKVERARPVSSRFHQGRLLLKLAPWNHDYCHELHQFPTKGVNDDQVDGTTGLWRHHFGNELVDEVMGADHSEGNRAARRGARRRVSINRGTSL